MDENSIETDEALDLCRNQRRRIVLTVLAEEHGSLTVDDLTAAVLEHDHQTPATEVPDDVTARVRLSLYHEHLPKMASTGVVEYDPEQLLVEPTEQFDRLQPYLSTVVGADPALESPVEL